MSQHEFLRVLKNAKNALIHDVPTSCYSTGPLTGTPMDNICIACSAINEINIEIKTAKQISVDELVRINGYLLEACKEALEYIENRTKGIVIDCKDSLRLAIKKAEGK